MISATRPVNYGNYYYNFNADSRPVHFAANIEPKQDEKKVKQEAMRKICGFTAIAAGVPLLAYLVLGLFTKGKGAKAVTNLAKGSGKTEQAAAKASTQAAQTAKATEQTAVNVEKTVTNAGTVENDAQRLVREAIERIKTRPESTPNEKFNSFVGKMRDTCRRACQGRPEDVCSVGEMIEQYQQRLMPKLIEKGVDKKLLQEFSDIFTNCETRKVTDVIEKIEKFAQKLGL